MLESGTKGRWTSREGGVFSLYMQMGEGEGEEIYIRSPFLSLYFSFDKSIYRGYIFLISSHLIAFHSSVLRLNVHLSPLLRSLPVSTSACSAAAAAAAPPLGICPGPPERTCGV